MDYSAGMRQRISLARALMNDPDILLLDEPTKNIDPESAWKFRKFLKEQIVQGMGKTILIASHSMEEVEYLCDRVALLDKGRIIGLGSPEQIKEYLKLKYVK